MRRRGIVVICAILCAVGLEAYWFSERPDRPFDPDLWQRGSMRERGRMARDLVLSRKLVGLTHDEVAALLGRPDQNSHAMFYTVDLGHRFVSEPWTYSLVIEFGSNSQKVTSVMLRD